MADLQAKAGTKLKENPLNVYPPFIAIKEKIENYCRKEWDSEWTEYQASKHTKEFYKGNDKTKAKYAISLSRWELSRLVKIVTGHGDLAFFYSKL